MGYAPDPPQSYTLSGLVWRKYAYQGGGCQLGLQLFLSKCISTMGGVSWNMEKTVSSKSSECINTRGAGIIRYHDANV